LRAYEVKFYTKKSIYNYFKNTKSNFKEMDFYKIYIDFPRQELIKRINLRTEEMIANGAINEVNNFIKLKVNKDKSVNKAIGINEIKNYLNNEKDLHEISEQISIKTRQYAKRQSTWARGNMKTWLRLKPKQLNKFLNKI
jgi:tRNA dimethylallyltransferase